jgi:uncharacterized protein
MKILSLDNCVQNKWSGGSTTELCIRPIDSSFAERNFDFRLSIATVEQEQTVFTSMPGYTRTLLLLSGELSLIHSESEIICLKPGGVHTFSGEPAIGCIGTGVDFNVICSSSVKCTKLELIDFISAHDISVDTNERYLLFCIDGGAALNSRVEQTHLNPNQYVVLENEEKIQVVPTEKSRFVVAILSQE